MRRSELIEQAISESKPDLLFEHLRSSLAAMGLQPAAVVRGPDRRADRRQRPRLGIEALTLLLDHHYPTWDKKRSSVLTIVRSGLEQIFQAQPLLQRHAARARIGGSPGTPATSCAARRAQRRPC